MTLDDVRQSVATYDALVTRAIKIAKGAPYWACCMYEDAAKVAINGNSATLSWPENDDYAMETVKAKFDANLLLLDDEALEKWKAEQAVLYKAEKAEEDRQRAIHREAQERAQFEELKKKYG